MCILLCSCEEKQKGTMVGFPGFLDTWKNRRGFLGGLLVQKRRNQLHMITSECVHATTPVYGKNHQDLHDHSLFHMNSELAAASSIMLAFRFQP
jgi:hypothetical protein